MDTMRAVPFLIGAEISEEMGFVPFSSSAYPGIDPGVTLGLGQALLVINPSGWLQSGGSRILPILS